AGAGGGQDRTGGRLRAWLPADAGRFDRRHPEAEGADRRRAGARMTEPAERLLAAFEHAEGGTSTDGIPFVRVPVTSAAEALLLLRDELGYQRLVDLTAVDTPERDDRFELNYLVHSLPESRWFRLKARTDGLAPSAENVFPGLNFYEREVFDLFGVRF